MPICCNQEGPAVKSLFTLSPFTMVNALFVNWVSFVMISGWVRPIWKRQHIFQTRVLPLPCWSLISGVAVFVITAGQLRATPPSVDNLPCPIVLTQVAVEGSGDLLATPYPGTLVGVNRPCLLVLLQPGREPEILVPSFFATAEADVFFDGKKLLLAGKPEANAPWNIYELDLETRTLRQITREARDCRSPSYQSTQYILDAPLPWFQITLFRVLSEEASALTGTAVSSLFSCRMDGSHFRRLTVSHAPDLPGTLLPDGRIVFASFRSSYPHDPQVRLDLLAVNTDGTDPANFLPGIGARYKLMPTVIPHGLLGKLVFIESDELTPDGAGQIACVDLRRPLRTYQRLTEDRAWVYHSPCALPDGRLLVSRRPRTGGSSFALGIFDLEARAWTPLFDDPRYHELLAKPVAPRLLPDGRSSGVDDNASCGTLYCLSVYDNDLGDQGFPKGSIKKLRVLQAITDPKTAANRQPRFPFGVLGEIPIYPDGSFQVEVPSDVPLALQLIDEQGINVRTSGWFWVKGGVHQGCIGCHEDPERVPFNRMADALWEDRPRIEPSASLTVPDFVHDVWPIIQRSCLNCHTPPRTRPWLAPSADPAHPGPVSASPAFSYAQLVRSADTPSSVEAADAALVYVVPGAARLSSLVWHVMSKNLAKPWDGEWPSRPYKPWPNDPEVQPLSQKDVQIMIEWIDTGALYDRQHPFAIQ